MNNQGGIQKLDFHSIFTTSIYWVITTFTSIGYGDVYGHTDLVSLRHSCRDGWNVFLWLYDGHLPTIDIGLG